MVFESEKVASYKNEIYVGNAYDSDGLLKMNVMVVKPKNNKFISSTYIIGFSNLWHGKLGHVN